MNNYIRIYYRDSKMTHVTKKYITHHHRKQTRKYTTGGIGNLPVLTAEKEVEKREEAIELIRELLNSMKRGEDIIRIAEPKVTERKKVTGENSELNRVFIGDKLINRQILSYMFAEITGIDKFRINHTTTSGEYKGHKILGNKMRNNVDMINGVEYVDGRKRTIRLLGLRELLQLDLDEYIAKYINSGEQRNVAKDLFDTHPIHVNKKKTDGTETGVLAIHEAKVDPTSRPLVDLFFGVGEEKKTDLPEDLAEPFLEEDQPAPKYKKIQTKLRLQTTPAQQEKEPLPEVVVETPIQDRGLVEKEKKPVIVEEEKEEEVEKEEVDNDDRLQTDEEAAMSMMSQDPSLGQPMVQTEKRNVALEKERAEYEYNRTNTEYDFLYPSINDPNFNIKIAKRKEFFDTSYNGTIYDIKKQAEILCNSDFELMPHQLFVKNFLSFQTPYNSLLLFHSLGTGKTCSAIGVAEELRAYMKQVGINQRIIVVASPNVKANFRMQLFDESKLRLENGLWTLNTCIGTALLSEINPTNIKGLPRKQVISQIQSIINNNYVFMGYTELANFISKVIHISDESGYSPEEKKRLQSKKIKKNFNNRLIIIDEVHNIRITDDNKEKRSAELLMTVASQSDNLRLLLLSATPMYNSYKEIIWLMNLINANDKRATISINDIFDKEGQFKPERKLADGRIIEAGKDILIRKLTGYVSYVRGENPYTFPYRIYPDLFAPDRLIKSITYPTFQLNRKPIEEPIEHVPVYISPMDTYQQYGYDFIMNYMRTRTFNRTNAYGQEINMPTFENMDGLGYTLLLVPLEALNIVYPTRALDDVISKMAVAEDQTLEQVVSDVSVEMSKDIIDNMIGKLGLSNIMTYKTVEQPHPLRYGFEYKPDMLLSYGRIFSQEHIKKYSNKISAICDSVMKSKGLVIIYSQYIDGGCVPIALALEELGFARWGSDPDTQSLFKTPPTEPLDVNTLQPKSEGQENFKQAKYVMLTGDKYFSHNNAEDIKYVTHKDNRYGEQVKVIIISKAAAEGLDFKNIRQIHVLEPWYNMNRIEQIIGRGVRNLSHCALPFEERNVEIYLHGTSPVNDEEPADLYVYRLAEKKAKQIGDVTRLLKETAVDCILNIGQSNFTVEKLAALAQNKQIQIQLSSMPEPIEYKVGDRPFTDICDYKQCNLTCSPNAEMKEEDIVKDTYNEDYVKMNYSMILKRIRELFREQSFYKWDQLKQYINSVKEYPVEQIYYTLSQFIENKNEYIIDRYGRRGYVINKGDIYAFQPIEVNDEYASIFDRTVPVDFKHETVVLSLPEPMSNKEPNIIAKQDPGQMLEPEEKEEEEMFQTYDAVLEDMQIQIGNALSEEMVIETGETDWYKHASKVIADLNVVHQIPMDSLSKYTIFHYLDVLSFPVKLMVVNHIYSKAFEPHPEFGEIETVIQTYFDEKMVTYKTLRGIVLGEKNKCKIYVQSGEDQEQWQEAKQTDKQKLSQLVIDRFVFSPVKYNKMTIGFMHMFKKQDVVFKIKDMNVERSTGARFENEKKGDIIKVLNKIVGERAYTAKNTETIFKNGLCVITEILLRYYTDTKKDDRIWFFDVEETLLNKIVQ